MSLPSSVLETFARAITRYQRIWVTTHHLPDGDGIGAQVALSLGLRQLGKEVYLLNASPTPSKFSMVDPSATISVYTPHQKLPAVDVVLIMDTSDMAMLGPLRKPIETLGVPVHYIDHHVTNSASELGSLHLIDEKYSSTGELAYFLLKAMGVKLDLPMAKGIYVSLLTDTESFRFRRTSERTHLVAAELLALGVKPELTYRSIYAQDSPEKLRFLGHVLSLSEFSSDQRVGWLTIRESDRLRFGATVEDTESFINHLTLVQSLEIAVLFREEDGGRVKVSLRGNGTTPVVEIAQDLGGGGHRYSAGLRMTGSLDVVRAAVLERVGKAISSSVAKVD